MRIGSPSILSPGARFLPGLVLLGTLIAGFWPTWSGLADLWTHSLVWSHGWLIAGVALWALLFGDEPTPQLANFSVWRQLPLLALIIAYVFVDFAHVDVAEQMLLPILGIGIAYALYGRPGVRRYAFPLLYVLFAVPFWDYLQPVLQQITVWTNHAALMLAGIDVSTQGQHILVPVGTFNVEGGCSGSHFFVVALAVSTLHARLWKMPRLMALASVAFAVTLSLFANWLRVFVIIVRAIQTNMQSSLIHDHYWFGWFLFAGTLIFYFLVMRHFDKGADRPVKPTLPITAPIGRWFAAAAPSVAFLLLLNAHAQWYHNAWARVDHRIRPAPLFVGTWEGPAMRDLAWHPTLIGAETEVMGTYRNVQGSVSWYRGIYTEQRTGAKLIGYGNRLVPEDWSVISQAVVPRSKADDYTPTIGPVLGTTAVSPAGERWRIWSWYMVANHKAAQSWQARMWQGLQGFSWRGPAHSGLVALAAPCEADCRNADQQLHRFSERLDGEHK